MKDLKKVLSYLKYDKKNLIITILLVIIESFFELLIPFIMKDIINKGIEQGSLDSIIKYGIIVIGCSIISIITGHLYAIYNSKTITNYSYKLRIELFKHVEDFSFENLDNFETNSLITRLTNDVSIMQQTLAGSIRPILRSPMMLIMGIILSFMLAPSLAWIFLAALPILSLILFLIVRYTAPKYAILQNNIDNLNLIVRENVTAIRTVKSYVKEDYEIEKFNNSNLNVTNTVTNTIKVSVLNAPAFEMTMYTVTVLLLTLGARLVNNNSLQVGTLSALLSYTLQVINSVMMLSNIFILINKSFASAARINEVLKEKNTMESQKNLSVTNYDIEFKDVFFKYKSESQNYVLNNINLIIPEGSSLGIMGGTGSSKTTLVSLILRLYDVSKGDIFIGNNSIKDYNLKELRNSISIVLQNNVLFSGSIRSNLLWGNKNATNEEINKALRDACAYDFVCNLPGGLDYDLGQAGVNVSGGQRQRLCIARSLLKKPKIIIFDDSTSACDMETERQILENIKKIDGVTLIIIGQRVRAVKECDNIIILNDGTIDSFGRHNDLYNNSLIYKELCDTQLGGDSNGNNAC